MKRTIFILLTALFSSCQTGETETNGKLIEQADLMNQKIRDHKFLDCMYQDPYFPPFLVDKCKNILLVLCGEIESKKPANLDGLYELTHAATRRLNDLQHEFFANNSEIETGARECLGADFAFISETYGFNPDVEQLIAPRDW
jgi:hypothetical protein